MILKPNIGGSGAKIVPFQTPEELRQAAAGGALDLGIDHTALVQEYLPAADNSIVRVEILGSEYLYAIRLHRPPVSSISVPPIIAGYPQRTGQGYGMASPAARCL